MIITKNVLTRRTLLRGLGASVALPLLEAMVPPLTELVRSKVNPPRRLGFVYVPMGADMTAWTPDGENVARGVLSTTLRSLSEVNGQVTVLTNVGLEHTTSGGHTTANAGFLSGTRLYRTESEPFCVRRTVDQLAAKACESGTAVSSLELAVDVPNMAKQVEYGAASRYLNHLSWLTPVTPAVSETRPEMVFIRLFGGDGQQFRVHGNTVIGGSVLDRLQEPMRRLRGAVGPADRRTASNYLEQIRAVEHRIQKEIQTAANNPNSQDFDRAVDAPLKYRDHVALMFDLQLLALRADITRVVSFQLARELSRRVYTEVGVTDPHHDVSHHAGDTNKRRALRQINRYHVELLTKHLQGLASVSEGDGTLLDNTTYMYGSGMGDPHRHDHNHLPIVLAGGRWRGGRGIQHLRFADKKSLLSVHSSLLAGVGRQVIAGRGEDTVLEPVADLDLRWQSV
ncbi:MAG: DUF1552 domain-containing protein [Acidobacteriota bacterium]|nr:DUF1552 domain-containing protein [Acidobacteriota bacterium]